jgi:hypothetical protein
MHVIDHTFLHTAYLLAWLRFRRGCSIVFGDCILTDFPQLTL